MFTRINLFVSPRHHRPHFGMGGWFAPMYNPMERIMMRMALPMMLGNMISNIGNNIAGIISGKGKSNCNCASNSNPYDMLYGNNNYATANTLYPYVDLSNTRTQKSSETEGKGSSRRSEQNATIEKMEKAYKKYGIESIYRLDDGRYCAVTKNGNITGLTLADLADEISDYYGVSKEPAPEEVVDDTGAARVAGTGDDDGAGDAHQAGSAGKTDKFSEQFKKSEWHRYLATPKSRADEFKNVSFELGKTTPEAHRNNPAEYALNSLINQLGLAGVKYDSDSYKNLLSDFKRMNPSVFNEDGTMKAGDNADKLDLPSKATLKEQYHLRDRNAEDDIADAQAKAKANAELNQKQNTAQETAINKAKEKQKLVNDAVVKLRNGIAPQNSLKTTNPYDITDVLFNKKIFNKDTCLDILNKYKNDYGKELFESIDSESWYYSDSKIQDYERILNVLLERAQTRVKDKAKLKQISDFRDKLLGDTYKKSRQNQLVGRMPLEHHNDIETFKQIMQIMREAG